MAGWTPRVVVDKEGRVGSRLAVGTGGNGEGVFGLRVAAGASRPAEAWWVLVRRWLVLSAAAVLLVAGLLTVVGQVNRLARPVASPVTDRLEVADVLVGTAVVTAVDYLSWDRAGREARSRALARVAAPRTSIDGWGADGRQVADSPAVLGVASGGSDAAVVTVRVRVVAYQPNRDRPTVPVPGASTSRPPVSADDGGPNVAPAPAAGSGWVALPARWWDVAVPVARVDGRVVVPAMPALVGSPSGAVLASALPDRADVGFAASTRGLVERMLRAYAADDLEFVRAPGSVVRGLPAPVGLRQVVEWRVAALPPGADGARRQGEVTVVWELPGDSSLRCVYRVELQRLGDRWLLAAVDVAAPLPR